MSTQTKPHYTLEEYFELEKNSDERYEFYNSEVFCMSGASSNHAQIETNLITSLSGRLRERGICVFPGNMRINVPAAPPYRYPDIVVVCDKPIYEKIGGIDALINPALIIEVLSASTEAYDRGDKFTHYKSVASFREYLLVAQHRPHVAQFVKQSSTSWTQTEVNDLDGHLHLPSVGCPLSLSNVYRDVEFSGGLTLKR